MPILEGGRPRPQPAPLAGFPVGKQLIPSRGARVHLGGDPGCLRPAAVQIRVLTGACLYLTMQSTFHCGSPSVVAAEVLMNVSLIKQPSALLPIAMSATALVVVLVHVVIFGAVHEADEGTAAHLDRKS